MGEEGYTTCLEARQRVLFALGSFGLEFLDHFGNIFLQHFGGLPVRRSTSEAVKNVCEVAQCRRHRYTQLATIY